MPNVGRSTLSTRPDKDPLEELSDTLEVEREKRLGPKLEEIQTKGWMIFMPVREESFNDLYTTVAVTMNDSKPLSVAAFGLTVWTALETLFETIEGYNEPGNKITSG